MTGCVQRVPALRVPGWQAIPNLVHGFYGRRGGVSGGPFAELNLSRRVGDDPQAVQENWRRMAGAFQGDFQFATSRQVHGTAVVTVDMPGAETETGDALVSNTAGVGLSVLTADCVPILLVAPQQRVVAAVHAGWRGTVAGIAERVVRHLERTFRIEPAALHVALGPAIGQCCYEVGSDLADALERRWGRMPEAIRRDQGPGARVDLRRATAIVLAHLGVRTANIVSVGPCTKCAATDYFSYRAAQVTTGRQLSFIGWLR